MRFNTKGLMLSMAVLAALLGSLLVAAGQDRVWVLLPYGMYIGLLLGWCVYSDRKSDKR